MAAPTRRLLRLASGRINAVLESTAHLHVLGARPGRILGLFWQRLARDAPPAGIEAAGAGIDWRRSSSAGVARAGRIA
jgi:hypothetical protein